MIAFLNRITKFFIIFCVFVLPIPVYNLAVKFLDPVYGILIVILVSVIMFVPLSVMSLLVEIAENTRHLRKDSRRAHEGDPDARVNPKPANGDYPRGGYYDREETVLEKIQREHREEYQATQERARVGDIVRDIMDQPQNSPRGRAVEQAESKPREVLY